MKCYVCSTAVLHLRCQLFHIARWHQCISIRPNHNSKLVQHWQCETTQCDVVAISLDLQAVTTTGQHRKTDRYSLWWNLNETKPMMSLEASRVMLLWECNINIQPYVLKNVWIALQTVFCIAPICVPDRFTHATADLESCKTPAILPQVWRSRIM